MTNFIQTERVLKIQHHTSHLYNTLEIVLYESKDKRLQSERSVASWQTEKAENPQVHHRVLQCPRHMARDQQN